MRPTPATTIFSNIAIPALSRPDRPFQCGDELPVLLRNPDGDANVLRKIVNSHGADDDSLKQEPLEKLVTVSDFHEDKIGLTRDVLESEASELPGEIIHSRTVHFQATLHVIRVFEGREG